jgi:hypothetical protein
MDEGEAVELQDHQPEGFATGDYGALGAEPCGVNAKEVTGCHRCRGQPHQVLASRAVHPMCPFLKKRLLTKIYQTSQ